MLDPSGGNSSTPQLEIPSFLQLDPECTPSDTAGVMENMGTLALTTLLLWPQEKDFATTVGPTRWQRRMSPTPQPDVTATTEHDVANYQATPYAGNVVLFRTYKDDYIGDIRWVVDSHNGWSALITGRGDALGVASSSHP